MLGLVSSFFNSLTHQVYYDWRDRAIIVTAILQQKLVQQGFGHVIHRPIHVGFAFHLHVLNEIA